MSCLRCFCCAMKFLMQSVVKLTCKRCIGWEHQVRIFLLSVKISCLRCFCCAGSVSGFFLCVLWIENVGCLGSVEEICVSIPMC